MERIVPISFWFVVLSNLFIIACFFWQDSWYKENQSFLWIINSALILLFTVRNGSAVVYYMNRIKQAHNKMHPNLEGIELDDFLRNKDPAFEYLSESDKELTRAEFRQKKRISEEAAGTIYNLNILLGLGSGNFAALILGYVNSG